MCLMDMHSFQKLFEQPRQFVRELRRQATELVKDWNRRYSGSKEIGNREHLEKVFVIEQMDIPFGGEVFKSEFRLAISTYSATRLQQMSSCARLTIDQCRVSLKHATSLPPRWARRAEEEDDTMRLSRWGIYLPFLAFEKLCHSKEVGAMVKTAEAASVCTLWAPSLERRRLRRRAKGPPPPLL